MKFKVLALVFVVSLTRSLVDSFGRHVLVKFCRGSLERALRERVCAVGVVASGLTTRFDVGSF